MDANIVKLTDLRANTGTIKYTNLTFLVICA
jgi:hypothetical protein